MNRSETLAVLTPLPIRVTPSGGVIITKKFVNGMKEYSNYWDGPISAFMEPTDVPTTNLDEYEVDPEQLPFKLEVVTYSDPKLRSLLAGHRLVLASVDYRQTHLAELCRSIGVPCVYVSEFALKTRIQANLASNVNPIIKLRRCWWEYNQERKNRKAIAKAAGIQCNGTPTFEAYRVISPSPLLFFDNRMDEDLIITDDELAKRIEELERGGPLRLLFSGRIISMKGADHLPRVADELRRLQVPFEMTIYGGGDLEGRVKAEIDRRQLGDLVKMRGTIDFKSELVPYTRRHVDLFVCCHRTGDPAGTYLDVMLCGVPIVGYENEAFSGIVRESGVGWITPMNRPEKVAEAIAGLNRDRSAISDASRRALEFGRRHTFAETFKVRIEHMKSCSAPIEAKETAE